MSARARVAVLALLASLASARAGAQEAIELGPPLPVSGGAGRVSEVAVAASARAYLVAWTEPCEVCFGNLWVRLVDAEGWPVSGAHHLEADGPTVSAAWTGARWVVLGGTTLHRLGEGAVRIDRHTLPGQPTVLDASVVGGDGGALAVWTVREGSAVRLSAAHVDAEGALGEAFMISDDWRTHALATWDGAAYWVWGGTSLARVGPAEDARVEETVTLEQAELADRLVRTSRPCIGSDGAGTVALGWPAAKGGWWFQALDASHAPAGAGPLRAGEGLDGTRCAIVPAPSGLRAVWDDGAAGGTRTFGTDGAWVGEPTDLLGVQAAARGPDGTLVAWPSWTALLDDSGEVLACAGIVSEPGRGPLTLQSPPLVAWEADAFRFVGQMTDGAWLSSRVRPDGLSEPWIQTGISGASCNRIACADDDWCAMACFEDPVQGACGQGGCADGDPGGPAIGWLHAGTLSSRTRAGPSAGSISDIEWTGGQFVAVWPGRPPVLRLASRAGSGAEDFVELPRQGRACSLAPDDDGLLAGCLAGGEGWILRVFNDGTQGEPELLPRLAELELARAGSSSYAAWVETDDPDGSLRFARLSASGAIEGAPVVVATDARDPSMVPLGDGVALAFTQNGALSVAALPGEGSVSPLLVESAIAPPDPGWGGRPFGLAASEGRLAVAYRNSDQELYVRLSPSEESGCPAAAPPAPAPDAGVDGGADAGVDASPLGEEPRGHLAGGGCGCDVGARRPRMGRGGLMLVLLLACCLAFRRTAALALLGCLVSTPAAAQESIDLGGPLPLVDRRWPVTSVAVAASDRGFLVGLGEQDRLRVRLFDPSGRPFPETAPIVGGGAILSAAWTGARWVVLAGSTLHRLDQTGALMQSEGLGPPGEAYPSDASLVGGDGGALLIWTVWQGDSASLRAAHLDAEGTVGEEFTVSDDWPTYSALATWDGEDFWVWGGPILARIGAEEDSRVEQTLTFASAELTDDLDLHQRPCIGSDGDGHIALGWPAPPLGWWFQALDASGAPVGAGALQAGHGAQGTRCAIAPDASGFRAFWNDGTVGATRAFQAGGTWVSDRVELPGFEAAARGREGYLVAWSGGTARLDGNGEVLACAKNPDDPIYEPMRLERPPLVAPAGSGWRVVGQAIDESWMSARVRSDGLAEAWGAAGISSASCNRIACADEEWCAMACYELANGCGQGGCLGGDPGGPAIGWLRAGELVSRVRIAEPPSLLSDIEWAGDRFVAVWGSSPNVQFVSRAEASVEEPIRLGRGARHCSLAPDEDGLLVGCVAATDGWIMRVHPNGALEDAEQMARLADLELARGGGHSYAAWIEAEDRDSSLRVARLGPNGAIESTPVVVATDTGLPSMAPLDDGVALAFVQGDTLSVGTLPTDGTVSPALVESAIVATDPGWGAPPFGLAANEGHLAVAYRRLDDGVYVRLSPPEEPLCPAWESGTPDAGADAGADAGGSGEELSGPVAGGGCGVARRPPAGLGGLVLILLQGCVRRRRRGRGVSRATRR